MRMKLKMAKLAAILWVLVVLGGLPAQADPMINGLFETSDGYTTGYYVNFELEGAKKDDPHIPYTGAQGQLWTYQAPTVGGIPGDLSMVFIQPKSLVDNSYGTTAVGWGSYAPSGKDHKFTDLIGSDAAQFVFTDGLGNIVLDFTMDYIHGYGIKPDDKPDKKLPPYASGGVVDGDGSVNVGSASDILAWATSLEYNWVNFGSSYPGNFGDGSNSPATGSQDPTDLSSYVVTDPPGPWDWVFDVIYEFKIDGSILGANSNFYIEVVHDSPNKIGKNKVYDDLELIPAPPAVILGVIGLGFSGWLGRRKFSV
ncbi:hypothetical protein ES703_10578 [subsurface metagenome]